MTLSESHRKGSKNLYHFLNIVLESFILKYWQHSLSTAIKVLSFIVMNSKTVNDTLDCDHTMDPEIYLFINLISGFFEMSYGQLRTKARRHSLLFLQFSKDIYHRILLIYLTELP